MSPQRLSFAGGGTDLPDFYRHHGGAVISATINKYLYVTVKRHSPLFNETYRLSYSKTEHVDTLDEIENDVARDGSRSRMDVSRLRDDIGFTAEHDLSAGLTAFLQWREETGFRD